MLKQKTILKLDFLKEKRLCFLFNEWFSPENTTEQQDSAESNKGQEQTKNKKCLKTDSLIWQEAKSLKIDAQNLALLTQLLEDIPPNGKDPNLLDFRPEDKNHQPKETLHLDVKPWEFNQPKQPRSLYEITSWGKNRWEPILDSHEQENNNQLLSMKEFEKIIENAETWTYFLEIDDAFKMKITILDSYDGTYTVGYQVFTKEAFKYINWLWEIKTVGEDVQIFDRHHKFKQGENFDFVKFATEYSNIIQGRQELGKNSVLSLNKKHWVEDFYNNWGIRIDNFTKSEKKRFQNYYQTAIEKFKSFDFNEGFFKWEEDKQASHEVATHVANEIIQFEKENNTQFSEMQKDAVINWMWSKLIQAEENGKSDNEFLDAHITYQELSAILKTLPDIITQVHLTKWLRNKQDYSVTEIDQNWINQKGEKTNEWTLNIYPWENTLEQNELNNINFEKILDTLNTTTDWQWAFEQLDMLQNYRINAPREIIVKAIVNVLENKRIEHPGKELLKIFYRLDNEEIAQSFWELPKNELKNAITILAEKNIKENANYKVLISNYENIPEDYKKIYFAKLEENHQNLADWQQFKDEIS